MKEVIYIRIDKKIKEELDKIAYKDNRSLNNYIVNLLTKIVEKEQEKKED